MAHVQLTKAQYTALYRLARLWTLHRVNRLNTPQHLTAIGISQAAWDQDHFNAAGMRLAESCLYNERPVDWLEMRQRIYDFHALCHWDTIPGDLYLQSRRAKFGMLVCGDY